MNTISPCFCANINNRISSTRCGRIKNPITMSKTHSHRIYKNITIIRGIKFDFPADGWYADAISITANSSCYARNKMRCFLMVYLSKAKCIQQCNRPSAHCKHITQDTPHPSGSPLIRLDKRGVVMALNFKYHGKPVTNIHNACILARPLNNALSLCG